MKVSTIVRRLLHPIGVDLVRYNPPSRMSAVSSRLKPKVPERIIIGGGDRNYGADWHNIEYATPGYADKYKALGANTDIALDLTSGTPFPLRDSSILTAYSSHVIEHLKDQHVRFILRETWRTLRTGGYLRLSCPNIDLYVRAFLSQDLEFFHYRDHPHYAKLGISESVVGLFLDVFATSLGERQQPYNYDEVRSSMERKGIEQAIEFYCEQAEYDHAKSHYHVNWFNPAKLIAMCKEAGFSDVYQSALGQSSCNEMRDLSMFDQGDPKISMFVECRK